MHAMQFVIILCMVGLDVGIQTSDAYTQRPKNRRLIISNSIGLIVMLAWSFVAFRAVKHENKGLAWILTVFLPIMYILPVVDIVFGEYAGCLQCSCSFAWSLPLLMVTVLCI